MRLVIDEDGCAMLGDNIEHPASADRQRPVAEHFGRVGQ
jgi:hypothetical protein